jgi:exodeoxyribonuclease V alpha subunit
MLRESRRFSGPIGQLALAVNAGDAARAATVLRSPSDGIAWVEATSPQPVVDLADRGATKAGAAGGYRDYLEALAKRPADAGGFESWVLDVLRRFDGFRVLCALRDGPWGVTGLNLAIERSLGAKGLIGRRGEWYEGRPIMVTRNDSGLGVLNGDVGLVLRSPGKAGSLRAYFADGASLRSVAVGRLADVQTAYAMTVHKSQGSEFGHVALVLPDQYSPVLTRELVYTGITRSKDALTMVGSRWAVLAMAIARLTKRASGLQGLL